MREIGIVMRKMNCVLGVRTRNWVEETTNKETWNSAAVTWDDDLLNVILKREIWAVGLKRWSVLDNLFLLQTKKHIGHVSMLLWLLGFFKGHYCVLNPSFSNTCRIDYQILLLILLLFNYAFLRPTTN